MIYTVTWVPSAKNHLADIYNQASDKQALSDAANRIDQVLRIDAHRQGIGVRGRRVFSVPPLIVVFDVSPDDRMVRVLRVRRTS